MSENLSDKSMKSFSPALGLIFGVPVGALFGIILNQSIAVFAGAGAGLGLIAGAVIQAILAKKK
ncbi:MAG: hypothetical protein IT308_07150 [Anaerolineaceae bacterium]|nr:hypothetical protein [Anaerolineaceae bacterium]